MTALSLQILRPPIVWALHFIAVYALISAACAPRGLLSPDLARIAAGGLTLTLALLLAAWMVQARRRRSRLDAADPDMSLAIAAWWSAQISLLAVRANLWPLAVMTHCTGQGGPMDDAIPFCGLPPSPAEVLGRWALDPGLLAGLTLALILGLPMADRRRPMVSG